MISRLICSIPKSPNTVQYYTETQNGVLITEVSSIQRSLQYHIGTQNGVLVTEVPSIWSSFDALPYYTGTHGTI